MIQAQIGHNPVNPSVERALEAEPAQINVGAKKSFLVDVLTIFLRSGKMHRQTQHGAVILAHQFFEGGGIAHLSLTDEKRVIDAGWADLCSLLPTKLQNLFHSGLLPPFQPTNL